MGLMQSFIYKISALVAVIALLSAFFNGVSMPTSIIRAGLIFLGTLVLFVVLLNIMRWAITTTTVIDNMNEAKEAEKKKVDINERNKLQGELISEVLRKKTKINSTELSKVKNDEDVELESNVG